MTVHLISVPLSSLTFFLFLFFMRCFVFLPFISLYTSPRLTGEERAKATSRKEIEDCAAEPMIMKISSSQLRPSSQVKLWLTRLHWIMVCDFWLFIYLFEIMKQIIFIFCLPFLLSENTFLGNTFFFLLYFQSIILACGMCLINLDLKLVQQDNSSSKI